MKKRKIQAEDIYNLKYLDSIQISPDEKEIILSLKTTAEDHKKYYSHLYKFNVDSKKLQQYTYGEVNDSNPIFSPNGKWIAFQSKRGEKKGIYLMPCSGGESRLIIEKDGSFSNLSFSPDSKKLLCVFRQADDFPKDKDGKKEPPVYRHITRLYHKMDNLGFYPKAEGQIWTFDIETGEGKQLTKGGLTKFYPSFSPDGRWIVYVTNIRRKADIDLDLTDIFIIPAKGGKARKIETPLGPTDLPKFSPDGKFIAYLGHDNPNDSWGVTNYHVWKVPIRGGKATDLIKKLDRTAFDLTISDSSDSFGFNLDWSADGRSIYFQLCDAGCTNLYRVTASGRKCEKVLNGKHHLVSFSLNGAKTKVAAIITTMTSMSDLYIFPTSGKGIQNRLTHFNKDFEKEIAIRKPEEVIVRGYDGYPIHGWIVKPYNFSAKKKYPSILQIHGGPRVQYGNSFFFEMQYLASQGYVVYYGNPRGGQGYGEAHADTVTNNWGSVDYDDCMAFTDYMEKKSYIHPRKMGVTGGSYGGYMTNWIVGHTNRYSAAVTQRSVVNMESMFGSSDIGYLLCKEMRSVPYNDIENYRRQSPLTFVKKIKTPLLIIHSEQDLRCPIEQGEQLFISLKMLGRTTEMVRFPDEPHGLSRCGRPDRRVARLEWIKKWFDRYLTGKR